MASDREIWESISRRDTALYDALYREHAPRLVGFLRQLIGNLQDAEDVAQEVFAQVWRRPQGFDPERGTWRAYLFGIGRKQAAEWWRRSRSAEEMNDERRARGNAEVACVVGDAFWRLPEEHRTLLWLREVEGQTYAELAVILEVPVGTVRSRLFAAREALREVWHSVPCAKGDNHDLR